jgi:hypothetical protein
MNEIQRHIVEKNKIWIVLEHCQLKIIGCNKIVWMTWFGDCEKVGGTVRCLEFNKGDSVYKQKNNFLWAYMKMDHVWWNDL